MRLIAKFITALAIGYAISRTERPIHAMEKSIAGAVGISDWYLILRYIIGTGALFIALLIMLADDDELSPHLQTVGMAALSGAVGVGSGVGLGFLKNSWEDLE